MATFCKDCKWYNPAVDNIPFCNYHHKIIGQSGCEAGIEKKQTNADRIRSMTDEELADYLRWHNDLYSRNGMDWLDWLREESK